LQWGPDAERTRRHAGGNANDALGRRVARTDTAGEVETANAFNYNLPSEVTNVVMGGTTYSYAYDPIGNRTESAVAVGNGQPDVAAYGANILNQYSAVTNSAASAFPREIVPAYDDDGNMTAYGPWTYTWDAENRMSSACSNGVLLVTNVYDHMSRRISKEVLALNGGTGLFEPVRRNEFLWDGWNMVREIVSGAGSTFTNYYTWGLDLSGTLQGAGGVGGLLAVTRVGPESPQPQVFYPCYDANGNVTAYLDSQGAAVGAFEYDAFGNTVAENVSGGLHLPFRFSTKYWDAETGLYYYGYRYYRPDLGRWVSRDPIGENGGRNLYVIVHNRSVDRRDLLGLTNDPGDFGWDWYSPNFFPNPPDLTEVQIRYFYQMLSLALQGAQTYILDERGKVHKKIVEEARSLVDKEVIANIKASGCCASSYNFGGHIGGVHAYGGKLFVNPLSAVFTDEQWGPLHYNFYTIGNTHNDIDYNVTVGTSRAMSLICRYSASVSMKGNIVDQFDFVPDRPNSGWKNIAYNVPAWVWSSVYNDLMRASRPIVKGTMNESWIIEGYIIQ